MNFPRSLSWRLASGLGALALSAAITGCGIGTAAPTTFEGNLAISGKTFGGLQPVVGATVAIYSAGTGGYGVGATQISTGTITTDSNGFFLLTGHYTCTGVSTPVYITVTGGNPGSGTNNALKLATTLGTCANLQATSYVWINEVTTAATAYAMSQFFTTTYGSGSTDSFGAPNNTQAQLGLTNAAATVANMVDTTTGQPITSLSKTGGITVTVEGTKLGTVANILSACVNSNGDTTAGAPCNTLFTSVGPTGTTPTDTLQAAVLMNLNPTSNNSNGSAANLTALYGLQTATPPYAGLASQPYDWTVGLLYSAPNNTTTTVINGANGIAIDGSGNVWIINYNSSATATESMAEFSPTGNLIANPFNGGGTAGAATMSAASPRNIAIDTTNNVFATSSSGSAYVYEYSNTGVSSSLALGSQPYGIAIDGSNNIFISKNSTSSAYGFEEFPGGTLATANRYQYPFNSINQFAAVSTTGNLYLAQGSTSSTQILQVSGIAPGSCTTPPCNAGNDTSMTSTYTAVTSGSIANPYGLAAGAGGGIWVADNGASSVTYVNGTSGTSYGSTASFLTPRFVAVDGANNAWFTNRGTASISEITTAGTILSPVTTTSGGTTTGTVGFAHSNFMSTQNGIAIDPSGNVWVANGSVANGTAPNSLFEMVGAAAPTVTPISLALKNGTVGAKP